MLTTLSTLPLRNPRDSLSLHSLRTLEGVQHKGCHLLVPPTPFSALVFWIYRRWSYRGPTLTRHSFRSWEGMSPHCSVGSHWYSGTLHYFLRLQAPEPHGVFLVGHFHMFWCTVSMPTTPTLCKLRSRMQQRHVQHIFLFRMPVHMKHLRLMQRFGPRVYESSSAPPLDKQAIHSNWSSGNPLGKPRCCNYPAPYSVDKPVPRMQDLSELCGGAASLHHHNLSYRLSMPATHSSGSLPGIPPDCTARFAPVQGKPGLQSLPGIAQCDTES